MACRILFYDFKESEKSFFEKNLLDNFCIKFFENSLSDQTVQLLSSEDILCANALCVSENSEITFDVINHFKNLRVIATKSKGCSHIDLSACLNKNIAVINVKDFDDAKPIKYLNTLFKGITGVLCGEKEYRVI